MRIVLIGFTIVLLVLSCGLAVRYNQDASYTQEKLDSERYKRIVSEEDLQKANTQISSLGAELKRSQDKIKNMEAVLEKTKVVNEDLKARLDKTLRIKAMLEEKIADLQQLVSPL